MFVQLAVQNDVYSVFDPATPGNTHPRFCHIHISEQCDSKKPFYVTLPSLIPKGIVNYAPVESKESGYKMGRAFGK